MEKARGASVFSCTINLAMTILGTGILAIPGGVSGAGLAFGLAFTLITAALSLFSLFLLGEMMPYGGAHPTLNSIAQRSMGKLGGIIVDLSLLCNCFGAATSYLIIASTSIESLVGSAGWPRQLYVLLCLVVVLPLCLLRRVDMLRFTSYLATLALLLLTAVVILFALPWSESSRWHALFDPCAGVVSGSCRGEVVLAAEPLGIVKQFVVFTNAYTCQQGMVPICAELERPTRRRKFAVISGAIGTACVLYLAVGVAGYLTFGADVKSDILRSYPDSSPFVSAARLGMTINVLTSYPLQVFFSRLSLASLLAACGLGQHAACTRSCCPRSRAAERDRLWRARIDPAANGASDAASGGAAANGAGGGSCSSVFLSEPLPVLSAALFIAATTAIALIVDDLGIVVNLTGATGATLIGYIAPGIVFALMRKGDADGRLGVGGVDERLSESTNATAVVGSAISQRLIDPVAHEEGDAAEGLEALVMPRVPLSPRVERALNAAASSLFVMGCILVPLAVTLTLAT